MQENNEGDKNVVNTENQTMPENNAQKAPANEQATRVKRRGFKFLYVLLIIVVAGVFVGALYIFTNNQSVQVVAPGDNVSVYYTGSFQNGTVFGSNVGGKPFSFIVNSGDMISGFNNAVIGMKIGETKNVTLPPDEAYGYVNQSLIVSFPRSIFGNNTVYVGERVSNGLESGVIDSLNATNTTINFNPPLAGYTLMFYIKIASINK